MAKLMKASHGDAESSPMTLFLITERLNVGSRMVYSWGVSWTDLFLSAKQKNGASTQWLVKQFAS